MERRNYENYVKKTLTESAELPEVEEKAVEVVPPTYADAIRNFHKTDKIRKETTKIAEEPKHEESPKKPTMVPGAKKLHLDESLFECIEPAKTLNEDSYGWQVKVGEEWALYEELLEYFGAEHLIDQIAAALGNEELGEICEYICRMNDFQSQHLED